MISASRLCGQPRDAGRRRTPARCLPACFRKTSGKLQCRPLRRRWQQSSSSGAPMGQRNVSSRGTCHRVASRPAGVSSSSDDSRRRSSCSSNRRAARTTSLALLKRPEATRPATKASISGVSDIFLVLTFMACVEREAVLPVANVCQSLFHSCEGRRRTAIVYWNSTYLADAVQHLRDQGKPILDALLAHTSPLTWEHIGFSGDFLWDRAAANRRASPAAQSRAGQGGGMIIVPGPFTLSVVCMITDAMPSTSVSTAW